MFFFFFSSRRRHTRCSRDWSSDVCSSDLRLVFKLDAVHETSGAKEPSLLLSWTVKTIAMSPDALGVALMESGEAVPVALTMAKSTRSMAVPEGPAEKLFAD